MCLSSVPQDFTLHWIQHPKLNGAVRFVFPIFAGMPDCACVPTDKIFWAEVWRSWWPLVYQHDLLIEGGRDERDIFLQMCQVVKNI